MTTAAPEAAPKEEQRQAPAPATDKNSAPAPEPASNREQRREAAKAARKKVPTLDQLRAKKPRKGHVTITIPDEDGEPVDYEIQLQAISSTIYDKLVAAHPPTNKQRERQEVYNIETFAPALISAVVTDPKMTVEEATELYQSDDWAPGEIGNLFFSCQRLCNMGLDVPFNGAV